MKFDILEHLGTFRKLNDAYSHAFRQLLQEPRRCSASQLFMSNNVPTFSADIRKRWCIHCISRTDSLRMFSYKLQSVLVSTMFHHFLVGGLSCCYIFVIYFLYFTFTFYFKDFVSATE